MNKAFKSVRSNSTGSMVAVGENAKSKGKSTKSKVALKLASASLALSASFAMLSPMNASADESARPGEFQIDGEDAASGIESVNADEAVIVSEQGDSASSKDAIAVPKLLGSKLLGAQLLGAMPTGSSVLYDDGTNGSITLQGTSGTTITNVKAGTQATDAVNFGQLSGLQTTVNNISQGGAGIKYFHVQPLTSNDADSTTTVAGDIAIGARAKAAGGTGTASAAVAIGLDAAANATQSTALGTDAVSNGNGDTAVGVLAQATGTGSYGSASALGFSSIANGKLATAMGYRASSTGVASVALGANSVADIDNTVSVGSSSLKRRIVNVSAGTAANDVVNVGQLQALGMNTDTSGSPTNAFVAYDDTTKAKATLAGGTAGTTITNVKAGALLASSTDSVNGSQLFATNQNVTQNTTDITQNSTDIDTLNTQVGALNTEMTSVVKYDATSKDQITLGGIDGTKISNLAEGTLSASSTDAVTGSQLFTTNQNVTKNTTDIATLNTQMTNTVKYDAASHAQISLGGTAGTKITNLSAGDVSTSSSDAVNGAQLYAVKQSITSQGGALADAVSYDSSSHDSISLDGTAGTTIKNVKAGGLSVSSTDAVNGSQLFATNQNVTKNTTDIGTLNTQMTSAVKYDTAANAVISLAGTSGTKIKNLAAGDVSTSSSDAVNGAQLYAVEQSITSQGGAIADAVSYDSDAHDEVSFGSVDTPVALRNVKAGDVSADSHDAVNGSQLFDATSNMAAALGGGARIDATGALIAPTYMVGGTQVHDVGSALTNLDGRIAQNSADIAGLKVGVSNAEAGLANATTNGVAYDSADHTKVTLGGTAAGTDAVQLTNVKAGDISAASTDAVNGAQLSATNDRVTATENALINLQTTGNSAAALDVLSGSGAASATGEGAIAFGGNADAAGSNSIAMGPNSQASGSNAVALGGNANASGENSVALGANSVADEANTVSVGSAGNERRVTNVAAGVNGTDAANVSQLNALRNDMGASLSSLQRSAFGGVAAAMAMPTLIPSGPGKTVVSAGVANYKGYSAIAAAATYRSGNGKWLVNGAASVTPGGDTGVRAQVGYEF